MSAGRKRTRRQRGTEPKTQEIQLRTEEEQDSDIEVIFDSAECGSEKQQESPPSKKSRSQTITQSPRKRSLSSTKKPVSSVKNLSLSCPNKLPSAETRANLLTPWKTGKARRTLTFPQNGEDGGRWCNIDEADEIPLKVLKFTPARTVGPQLDLMSKYSPLELFQLFFSTKVINLLVKHSNSYGKRNISNFTSVTSKDMYSYIALVIYMGLVPLKMIKDFWKKSRLYSLPFPRSNMSRDRFSYISSCLHMNDPDVEAANELKRGTAEYDKLCKVRPLYDHIVQACQCYYHPKQHISIDERMVASKARIGFKQYVKNKPTKWGFKLFVLADSSGYTVNFFVYDGKAGEPSGHGQSYDVVMRLLKSTNLGTGYKLYVDNYYTSPTLFRHLLQKKISACGTIRSTLRDYPKATANKMPPKAPRGSIRWLRQKELLFMKWYDAREVTMCTTMHKASSSEFVKRKVKDDSGRWKEKQVPVPDCIKDYNQYMGGVDLSDSLINSYNVIHKTMKWYKTLFYHFIDIAAVNAYILHRQLYETQNKKVLPHKEFREALIQELADIGCASDCKTPTMDIKPVTPITVPPSSQNKEPRIRFVPIGHLPASFSEHMTEVPRHLKGSKGRKTCVVCKRSSMVYCSVCLKTMCFTTSRNCYREYHHLNHIAS